MAEQLAALHSDSTNGTAPALRIVIGENNSDLATTVCLLLESEPDMCCCATAASGSAVLAAIEQHTPNAFILDLSLDDGPSLPLISKLRERVPEAVIVVFTGYRNHALNEQCLRAGANDVVVKSGDIDALIQALRRAARPTGSRGAAASALR